VSAHRPTSRRRFLARAGSGLLVLSGGLAAGCNMLFAPDVRDAAREVAALLRHPELARRLGRAYLEAGDPAGARSLEAVTRALLDSAGIELDAVTFLRVADLIQALAGRVREDFAGGETVAVEGWLLARSEARACAIAHLRQDADGAA